MSSTASMLTSVVAGDVAWSYNCFTSRARDWSSGAIAFGAGLSLAVLPLAVLAPSFFVETSPALR